VPLNTEEKWEWLETMVRRPSKEEVFRNTLELLEKDPEIEVYIQRIVDWENTSEYLWRPSELQIPSGVMKKLLERGIVVRVTNAARMLSDRGAVTEALLYYRSKKLKNEESYETEYQEPAEIPEDLFSCIIGHDKIKRIVMMALKAEKPVHLLFVGPEASGKTLFLLELARLPGAKYYSGGGQITKAGLAEMLFDVKPRYLLIDELDEVKSTDLSILLSLMETGIVTRLKHKTDETIKLDTRVFAAMNPWDLKKLPRDFLDRFRKIQFREYTDEEFIEVVTKLLTTREGTDEELAEYIAMQLLKRGKKSVREAIGIARMCKTKEDVDEVLEVLLI